MAGFLLLTGLGDALAQERPAWRDDPLGNRFVLGAVRFGQGSIPRSVLTAQPEREEP